MNSVYLAGLFDAEGSISLYFRDGRAMPQLQMSMLDSPAVEKLYDKIIARYGGSHCLCSGNMRKLNLKKNASLGFLSDIYPYMIIKRTAARVLLMYLQDEIDGGEAYDLILKANLTEKKRINTLPKRILPFLYKEYMAGMIDGDGSLDARKNGNVGLKMHMFNGRQECMLLNSLAVRFGKKAKITGRSVRISVTLNPEQVKDLRKMSELKKQEYSI